MSTILETIASYAALRVAEDKKKIPLQELRRGAEQLAAAESNSELPSSGARFKSALQRPGISFICEVKKASPSKGVIAENFPYVDIAKQYEAAGADCISCLTEPKWFLGSDRIFEEIHQAVATPMLRKDFTVDPYQIYQAKVMGASAVLLICSLLDKSALAEYLQVTKSLGLAALVEAHDQDEITSAVDAGAEIIGVNNRNLKDFSVDVSNSGRLRQLVPPAILFVAESGIKTPEDVALLKGHRVDGVLIGETLMRAPDKSAMLKALRGEP